MPKHSREFWLILIAFFTTYVVWGSTYLANAWTLQSIPPFLLAAIRFLIAGILLLIMARIIKPIQITKKQLLNCGIAGFAFFTIGNGMAVWSLKYIDSGIAALIVSLQPLIVALMMWGWKKEKPKLATWGGIALGILGMALLIGQPTFIGNTMALIGILAVVIALIAWAIVSIWIPDADLPDSIMLRTALQMIFGGILLLIVSPLLGEFEGFSIENISARSYWSLAYLIVFGSIFAMSAFNYLLQNVSPTKVVTNTYVNPVIAMFLGWWLNNEAISFQSVVAGGLLLAGVVFITQAKRLKKA